MATTTISGDLGTEIISDTIGYRSAESTFAFYGDFGGGTLTIEAAYDDDGLIFIPLRKPDGELLQIAQNEIHTINLGKCLLRYKISADSTTAPAVFVTIKD